MLAATLAPGRGRAQFDLQSKMPFQIANVLMDCGVPFVFATDSTSARIPACWAQVMQCEKPADFFYPRSQERCSAKCVSYPGSIK